MDLISREAVLDRIDKYIDKAQSTGTIDDFNSFAELGVKALPSAFEGMTNGEVIQAMFPNFKTETISFNGIRLYIDDEAHTKIADFTHRWWNAPYKAESEG